MIIPPSFLNRPFLKATRSTNPAHPEVLRRLLQRDLFSAAQANVGWPFWTARDAVWHRKTWEKHTAIVVKCCEMLWNIVKICEMMWKRLNWKVRKVRTVGKWQRSSTGKLGHEANMIMTPVWKAPNLTCFVCLLILLEGIGYRYQPQPHQNYNCPTLWWSFPWLTVLEHVPWKSMNLSQRTSCRHGVAALLGVPSHAFWNGLISAKKTHR